MKIPEKLIRIGLILLILLSLYFSFNIWLSSSKKEQPLTGENQIATAVNERSIVDVFQPLKLVKKKGEETQITSNENLISSVQAEIRKADFGKLNQVVNQNKEQFDSYLTFDSGIELLYEAPFLLNEYIFIYKLKMDVTSVNDSENIYFTKIQLDFDNDKIRFFNFSRKNVYEATLSVNVNKINDLVEKEGIQYYAVKRSNLAAEKQYLLTNDMQMKKYSYILASQPITRFKNAFFNNIDNIRTSEDSKDFSYTSNNEILQTDSKEGTILFRGNLSEENRLNNDVYTTSYSYVKKLGTSMGNLRYFDRGKAQVNYRTFVEGFPVFSQQNKGQVQVAIERRNTQEQQVTIYTSVDTIQIPIPSEEVVTIESADKLLEKLKKAGTKTENIKSLVIGYTWQTIEETKQVVDLTPEWYVNYNKQWYSENELLAEMAHSEVQ